MDRFDKSMKGGLTIILMIGFFAVLGFMLWKGLDAQLMIGALIGAWGTNINWNFGTTSSSERKTELLAQAEPIAQPDGGTK